MHHEFENNGETCIVEDYAHGFRFTCGAESVFIFGPGWPMTLVSEIARLIAMRRDDAEMRSALVAGSVRALAEAEVERRDLLRLLERALPVVADGTLAAEIREAVAGAEPQQEGKPAAHE